VSGRKRGRPFRFGLAWVAVLVSWVTTKTSRDFGFLRKHLGELRQRLRQRLRRYEKIRVIGGNASCHTSLNPI
jgi:hypothetical protein